MNILTNVLYFVRQVVLSDWSIQIIRNYKDMSSYSRYRSINVEKKLESVCYYAIPKKRKKKQYRQKYYLYEN